MGKVSTIQWTDGTWNVAVGCDKVDGDCKYCYMYRQSLNNTRYNPNQVRKTKTVFDMPLKYTGTKSTCWDGNPLIFTSSLTDFFHKDIDSLRNEVWDIIRRCPHLTFQILTKRPERALLCLPDDWGNGWNNVWIGTSVGSNERGNRLTELSRIPAKVRFLSLEPLYENVRLIRTVSGEIGNQNILLHDVLRGKQVQYHPGCKTTTSEVGKIDWVIVGGESGNENGKYKYRPCKIEWIESIVDDCKRANVPVFVKQLGTYLSKELKLSDRHGGDIDEFPTNLQIRQFPLIK